MYGKSMNLILNGLDPKTELARHERLAVAYRVKMSAMGRKRGWQWRDYLASAAYHEAEAAKLRAELTK